MSIKIKCNEANHVCDKSQYKEANFWEKIKLTIHLIYCKACKEYSSRNKKLTQAIEDSRVTSVSSEEKQILKEKLQKELSK